MTFKISKFVISDGIIYSMHRSKWKRYLKSLLSNRPSLPKPELKFEDLKIVANNVFDMEKLKQDDRVDAIRNELLNLDKGEGK